jgi:hypothetical protein
MLLEQFLNKQMIDMHGASNIMKSGNQFILLRKYFSKHYVHNL